MSSREERARVPLEQQHEELMKGLAKITERLDGLRAKPHDWTRSFMLEHHFEPPDGETPTDDGYYTSKKDFTAYENDRARAVMIKSVGLDYLLTADESGNFNIENVGNAKFKATANRVPFMPEFELDFGDWSISNNYQNDIRYIYQQDFRDINQVLRSGEKFDIHSELTLQYLLSSAEIQCHARFAIQLVDIFDPRVPEDQ